MWLPVKLGICCGSNAYLEQRREITSRLHLVTEWKTDFGRRKADQGGGYCRSPDAWSRTRVVAVEVEEVVGFWVHYLRWAAQIFSF